MTDRRRQTNAGLVVTVLIVALLVVMSVGAVVLVGTTPVVAQSNETGATGDDATTGAPPGGGSSENATTSGDNASSSNESGDDSSDSSDRTESAFPDTGSGSDANASGNGSTGSNESGNSSSSSSDAYTAGENDDDNMFSISIDPVGLLIRFFEPWFTFGTSLLVGMAEALQSSTQYPMQDGSVAISGEPDGDLMSLLYEYWYGISLVAGAAIWLINTMVLYLLTMVWPATPTYQEMVIARKEAWLKLFLIPFSWALGTIILFTASFALNAIPLDPNTIAPDTSSIAANNAAAGISVLLFYTFGGAFALAIAFTFFVTWLFLYIIFPAMPILIAMSVPKAWIMKGVAEAFEGILQLFPSAAFFPLPAVVVLSVGYSILGAIENLLPGPAEWGAVPVSAVAIIVIWLLAFIASIYMFWFKRIGSGAGAILAGSVGLGAISSTLGRLGGGAASGGGAAAGAAGGAAGGSASSLPGGVKRAVDGHALRSGSSSGSSSALESGSGSSSLSAGGSDLASTSGDSPTTAGTATGANPSGTAIPSGSSGSGSPTASAATTSSGTGSTAPADSEGSLPSRIPVDDPDIQLVEEKDDLPKQDYRAGYFTGTGPGSDVEFQKMLGTSRSRDMITGETYKRVSETREEDLFVLGQDDNQFYDVSPIEGSNSSGLDLSEAEQNAESRSTVNDARGL